jgi:decaprenylphospho-beta-D-erythro-pentofuranosid-2-ulose 2-reductase
VTKWKTAIVVGASSGIGEAIARRLAAEGTRVALLARRGDELQRVADEIGPERALVRTHDVIDGHAVPELWDEIEAAIGDVDLLVYASGLVIPVDEHEYTYEKDERMIAVNLVGAMAWLDQAAVRMEARRGGTIIGISSIAGDRGRRGNPLYGTSKAALNHYLEALRNRLGVFGVHVCTIKPGYVDTAMTRGKGLKGAIPAEQAARLILRAARLRLNVWYVPFKWTLVGLVLRLIPSFVFRRLEI